MNRTKPIIDYVAYVAVRTVVCIIQAAPLTTCQAWSRRLGWLFWHVLKLRRATVEENLRTAFPEQSPAEHEAIALAMWEHLLLMVCEIAHAPRKINRTNWRTHLAMPDMPLMVRRLLDRRPVVIISGHLGNFEMGGYLLGLHGFPTHTIARTLDNGYLDRWINEFREATGQFILPKHGSSQQIEELLKSGGTLVLLGDQHAGEAACWVDFFGRPASTHKAVSLFSLGNGAPTMVSYARRLGEPLHYEVGPQAIVDPREPGFELGTVPLLAQWYTDELENLIRKGPEQYWWLHRRWKGQPTARAAKRSTTPNAAAA